MTPVGRHILVELHGCDRGALDDREGLEVLLHRAGAAIGASVVASLFHPLTPCGLTGVVVLEESHISIHTWPEVGYAAADVFTCGRCTPEAAVPLLEEGLGASRCDLMTVERGVQGLRQTAHVAR